jgi:hypothetical protein
LDREELEQRICEFAATRGVTIDLLLFMDEMEYNNWGDGVHPTKSQLRQHYVLAAKKVFSQCLGDVLFNDAKTMKTLLTYTADTTPYDAVTMRSDWERALVLVSELSLDNNLLFSFSKQNKTIFFYVSFYLFF